MNGFTQAEPCIPCLDRWPGETLTEQKAEAYHRQKQAGNIKWLRFSRDAETGITVVEYQSNCPQDWMRQQLSGMRQAQPAGQITMEGIR